jgi:hypothetical protein
MRFVKLTWLDSTSNLGWLDKEDCEMSAVESIGILVAEDKDKIIISTSYDKGSDRYVDPLSIPKRCVIKRRNINI